MHYGLNSKVIFTIHNLEFGIHQISKAMSSADKATTVSSFILLLQNANLSLLCQIIASKGQVYDVQVSYTYSKEVSGNPAIAPHLHKFHGIVNGIDLDIWDPYKDDFIPVCPPLPPLSLFLFFILYGLIKLFDH